jgi:hypothetical protein
LKNNILIIIFNLIVAGYCQAQLGLGLQMELQNLSVNNLSSNDLASRYSLQYLLRLKTARVEFLPGLSLGTAKIWLSTDQDQLAYYREWSPQVQVPVMIYPFDLKNDCNCPTFKKSGNPVSKGLHLIAMGAYRFNIREFEERTERRNLLVLGAGLGMDFGMSSFFTLSPFMMYQAVIGDRLGGQAEDVSLGHNEFSFGLRGMFHKEDRRRKRR